MINHLLAILFTLLISTHIMGSEEWYEDYKPETWKVSSTLPEVLADTSNKPVWRLLGYLHVFQNSSDRVSLKELAKQAQKNAHERDLFDVALMLQKVGFYLRATSLGHVAVRSEDDSLTLAQMAWEYQKANLGDLSLLAAEKALRQMQANPTKSPSWYIGLRLKKAGFFDQAETAYIQCLQQAKDWGECFALYKELKALQKTTSALQAFQKTLRLIQEGLPHKGTGWFLYVATYCLEHGYILDAHVAAESAIEYEEHANYLLEHIHRLVKLEFEDLVKPAIEKLLRLYLQDRYSCRLLTVCNFLCELGYFAAAEKLFETFLPEYDDLASYERLFGLVELFNAYGLSNVTVKGLERLIELAEPGDYMVHIGNPIQFVLPSYTLLMTAQMSQECRHESMANQSANKAISCALSEGYDSGRELQEVLQNLARNFYRLNLVAFGRMASYYYAETESPSIRVQPRSTPSLFSIYWTDLTGSSGCEIKKRRPCIVVSSASSYGKRKCVTIIPLSTKRKGGLLSIPLVLADVEQEARIDQLRTVDVSRLEDLFGELPEDYQAQVRLAVKNAVCC